ncbi:MAG: hypothetical protein HQL91_04800 [Magnetococcales bacterium]|nr:hypothetical protein [Magnetococcales bacterium]
MSSQEDNTMRKAADGWRIAKSPHGQNVFSSWLDTAVEETRPGSPEGRAVRGVPASWVETLQERGRFKPPVMTGAATLPWKGEEAASGGGSEPSAGTGSHASGAGSRFLPAPGSGFPLFPARQRIYAELVRRAFGVEGEAGDAPRAAGVEQGMAQGEVVALPAPLEAAGSGSEPVRSQPDPRLVEALLPGVMQALADGLRTLAQSGHPDPEGGALVPVADELLSSLARDQAAVLLNQARALVVTTLTLARELGEQAVGPG